jgi:hypothetical protein
MQDQRQTKTQTQPEQSEHRRDSAREPFELLLPDGTDVSEIRIEVGQLNDINFGF